LSSNCRNGPYRFRHRGHPVSYAIGIIYYEFVKRKNLRLREQERRGQCPDEVGEIEGVTNKGGVGRKGQPEGRTRGVQFTVHVQLLKWSDMTLMTDDVAVHTHFHAQAMLVSTVLYPHAIVGQI